MPNRSTLSSAEREIELAKEIKKAQKEMPTSNRPTLRERRERAGNHAISSRRR